MELFVFSYYPMSATNPNHPMTTTPPNSAPVFPVPYMGKPGDWTVRDEFAKSAMEGMIVSHGESCDGYREILAKQSFAVADAMLAERAKQQKGTTP